MEKFIPVEIFRKKVIPLEVLRFSRFLPKGPKFSVPFVWIIKARLQVERERKNSLAFCKWYSCFRCQKTYQYYLTETFPKISVQMVSAHFFGFLVL